MGAGKAIFTKRRRLVIDQFFQFGWWGLISLDAPIWDLISLGLFTNLNNSSLRESHA